MKIYTIIENGGQFVGEFTRETVVNEFITRYFFSYK